MNGRKGRKGKQGRRETAREIMMIYKKGGDIKREKEKTEKRKERKRS